jgi:dihydroxyacetone kinase DhaKLM complex PTS-EIIA-like component DhaM
VRPSETTQNVPSIGKFAAEALASGVGVLESDAPLVEGATAAAITQAGAHQRLQLSTNRVLSTKQIETVLLLDTDI